MRLTTLILLTALIQASAAGFAQKVTLKEKETALKAVIKKITAQTGFDFLADFKLVADAKPVSIYLENATLELALNQIFKSQQIAYQIKDRFIVLSAKENSFLDDIIERFENIDISGRVTDEYGSPLVGASVHVKGSSKSVQTNVKGEFNLRNVEDKAIIVIAFVGYQKKEIPAAKDLGTIRLEVAVGDLNEVDVTVNTGYQRIKPEQSTGAIAQLGTKEYESRINTNFLDGLTNRLPGLMINNDVTFTSDGVARPLFNIRGISTMSANQNPLIVVDGYPTELTLDMIDPNEIQSVTVLKDAAAATVYGVRASNGVIVVNRKQAVAGKPKFVFRGTLGVKPPEDYSRYRWDDSQAATVLDYQRSLYAATINSNTWTQAITSQEGRLNNSMPFYTMAQLAAKAITPQQAESSFSEMRNADNVNEYRDLFLQSALTQTYNMNISGGSDKSLYYITTNYVSNQHNAIGNKDRRLMLSIRNTLKLSQKLSLELSANYQESFSNTSPIPGISSVAPYEKFLQEDGSPNYIVGSGISPWYNAYLVGQGLYDQLYYPLIDREQIRDKNNTINNRFTANFIYALGSGFDLSFGGVYETSKSNQRYLATEQSSVARGYVNSYAIRNTDGILNFPIPKGGFLRETTASTSGYTGRVQLNYNKVVAADHSFNAIAGAEVRSLINKGNIASYFGYNDETLLHQPVDFASIMNSVVRGSYNLSSLLQNRFNNFMNQSFVEDRFLSAYTNVVYAYKGKYSLTGSMRIDQSNLFGTDPKYKYKPLWSIGSAWNLHHEDFIKQISAIDQLKLRAAYGFNGNVAKNSLPQVIATTVLNNFTTPASPALKLFSYANRSLRWEQTKNFNLGIDYGLFKKISGSFDYYRKVSTDLLGSALIDPTVGLSPTMINQANINNTGLELAFRGDLISHSKFNWYTGIVLARNTSKVAEIYQTGDFNPQIASSRGFVKNYPVGALFSYRWAGLDNEGYAKVKNPGGQEVRTNIKSSQLTNVMSSESAGLSYYQGSSIPTINAGITNRFDIGDFYVFTRIDYYGGFKVRVPRANPAGNRPLAGAGTFWKKPGDEQLTDVMSLVAFNNNAAALLAYNNADKYVVHGDYVSLGDLTLSYSLRKIDFIKRLGFSSAEVKAQASNLWTIGLNRENFSMATRSYEKSYVTPIYTFGIFTNF